MANFLASNVLEHKYLTIKKEKEFLCQISDKPTFKSITLVYFVDTDVYLVEKQTVIRQLLYVTRKKRKLSTFCFIKGTCTTLHLGKKV